MAQAYRLLFCNLGDFPTLALLRRAGSMLYVCQAQAGTTLHVRSPRFQAVHERTHDSNSRGRCQRNGAGNGQICSVGDRDEAPPLRLLLLSSYACRVPRNPSYRWRQTVIIRANFKVETRAEGLSVEATKPCHSPYRNSIYPPPSAVAMPPRSPVRPINSVYPFARKERLLP